MALNLKFSPGDIIQDFEEPFVKYLYKKFRDLYCNSCFKCKTNLRRCPNCKTISYCNSDCQRADWENSHSIECELFSKSNVLSSVQEDIAFQVIKLLAYLKKNGVKAKKSYRLYNGTTRCFDDLQDYFSDISNSKTIRDTCRKLAMTLKDTKLFTVDESRYEVVMHLYGIWCAHSFAVSNNKKTKVIGAALYISLAAFDHSCRPNAIYVTDSLCRMQVRCIDAIPFGEDPKVECLGMRPSPRIVRQESIFYRSYSICECVLCEMEKDAPVVDYDDLHRRRTELFDKKIYTVDDFQRSKDVIQELQKIFCQYDPRISIHFYLTFDRLDFTLLQSSGHMVKEFAEQAEKNLQITYGTNHIYYYKCFIQQLQPTLRDEMRRLRDQMLLGSFFQKI